METINLIAEKGKMVNNVYTVEKMDLSVVKISGSELGFSADATFEEICASALKKGLRRLDEFNPNSLFSAYDNEWLYVAGVYSAEHNGRAIKIIAKREDGVYLREVSYFSNISTHSPSILWLFRK